MSVTTAQSDIRFIRPGDDEWPEQLDDLDRSGVAGGTTPAGLWVRGPLRLDQLTDSIGIVGARACTQYGMDAASAIAAAVSLAQLSVVSGAAFGIDTAASRGALAVHAPTVVVLANGVDIAYPRANARLLDAIAETGAIVSEHPPGTRPLRHHFLARNRIIAALTKGTVVVEAALRSGALSTATWAAHLGRHVMGVPGPVTAATSAGVNQLIRRGMAGLVTSGAEVIEQVSLLGDARSEEWLGLG